MLVTFQWRFVQFQFIYTSGSSLELAKLLQFFWAPLRNSLEGQATTSLRIQTPPDRIGLRVPIPSQRNRNVGVIPFLGHTWILRALLSGCLYCPPPNKKCSNDPWWLFMQGIFMSTFSKCFAQFLARALTWFLIPNHVNNLGCSPSIPLPGFQWQMKV